MAGLCHEMERATHRGSPLRSGGGALMSTLPALFTGQERFNAVGALGVILRDEGISVLEAEDRAVHWNRENCDPPLDPSNLDEAIRIPYVKPARAARIVSGPVPTTSQAA